MHQLGFAAIVACTVYVILDIEYPRAGVGAHRCHRPGAGRRARGHEVKAAIGIAAFVSSWPPSSHGKNDTVSINAHQLRKSSVVMPTPPGAGASVGSQPCRVCRPGPIAVAASIGTSLK